MANGPALRQGGIKDIRLNRARLYETPRAEALA